MVHLRGAVRLLTEWVAKAWDAGQGQGVVGQGMLQWHAAARLCEQEQDGEGG